MSKERQILVLTTEERSCLLCHNCLCQNRQSSPGHSSASQEHRRDVSSHHGILYTTWTSNQNQPILSGVTTYVSSHKVSLPVHTYGSDALSTKIIVSARICCHNRKEYLVPAWDRLRHADRVVGERIAYESSRDCLTVKKIHWSNSLYLSGSFGWNLDSLS